ncbi:hypothetical protein MYSTI_07067 [Myxococcus stipitatus DSM 14675]|uniref:Uncharacterized protein n=1 Tax=Myxococcus stipitatus (strain DSM 14675 / JCM 12634 / Mx s8) TaxID=1278073 RepID=L7UP95_MYXSD|nr:hypothetical protein [Myxococcus stipitatus]AGC48339.1 hypothetical protein MYSTI_07067 [Myxococcus stipitatus DSM 14675]
MTPKTRDDIAGAEHDWLAVDQDGYVGFFSSAGGGYAPDAYLQDVDVHDTAISVLFDMEPRTSPVPAPGQSSTPDDYWQKMAARGVYAFDSSHHGGPYHLLASPLVPASLKTLPEEVARAANRITYKNLSFSTLSTVYEELLKKDP